MKKKKAVIALLAWLLFSYMYTQNFQFLENINNKFTDIFFYIRGVEEPCSKVVIVDVDEKSLSEMKGFSREKLALMITRLAEAKVAVIGLEMTFPSLDRYSPKTVLDSLGLDAQNVEDYDKILSAAFTQSSLVSGFIFDFSSKAQKGKIPNISSVVAQKNFLDEEFLPEAKGIISNLKLLQDSSKSSGFFNMISDEDGVTRSAPLVIKYKGELYPSLSLEIVRTYWKKRGITINYAPAGINSIMLDSFEIPTDRFGRVVVNYKNMSKSYNYISAYKIYNGSFDKAKLKDKIVLIGSSTSRFYDLRATPFDSTFPAIEIQANVIDNIINNDFLIRPNSMEVFDISILFILLLLLTILDNLVKNRFLSVLLVGGFLLFAFVLFDSYGIIINILFPLVAGFTLYSILTSMQYINEVKQKENLNKKLILEMQNRQDIIQEEVTQKTQELQKVVEEKTVLLRELHHRVKNNLQLILSITRLQQYEFKDKKLDEEFSKLQNRIKSIAKTHEILCNNDDISNVDMSEYIGELCEEMESGFVQSSVEISIDVHATLPLRQAVYVGLVVNEIISNSIKHAFGKDGGEIHVYLAKVKEEYILRISDDGKGYEKSDLKEGSLGLKLVDALVVNQLEGSIKVQSDNRFGYIIKFKVSDK